MNVILSYPWSRNFQKYGHYCFLLGHCVILMINILGQLIKYEVNFLDLNVNIPIKASGLQDLILTSIILMSNRRPFCTAFFHLLKRRIP